MTFWLIGLVSNALSAPNSGFLSGQHRVWSQHLALQKSGSNHGWPLRDKPVWLYHQSIAENDQVLSLAMAKMQNRHVLIFQCAWLHYCTLFFFGVTSIAWRIQSIDWKFYPEGLIDHHSWSLVRAQKPTDLYPESDQKACSGSWNLCGGSVHLKSTAIFSDCHHPLSHLITNNDRTCMAHILQK